MKKSNLPYLLIAILVIWSLVLSVVTYKNYKNNVTEVVNEYNVSGFSTDFTDVVEKNKAAIVSISSNGTISSGFVYKQVDNVVYILTSYHGVSSGNVTVSFDNLYNVHGEIVGKDVYADLAVISIETDYTIMPMSLGDATILKDGEFVISIGTANSLDYSGSVELGLVSSDTRVVENSISISNKTYNYYLDVIQLSSSLNPGYSGGPVLNMNGEVVGMTLMSLDDDVNFALTANEIKIIAENIISGSENHKYNTGIKGAYIKDMATYTKTNLNLDLTILNGLYVQKVLPNSLASMAGISAGDIVLSINDKKISGLNDYLNAIYTNTDSLTFEVLRGEDTLELTVTIND